MIKHTMTKKQQFVLCAMYVESLGEPLSHQDPTAQAFNEAYGGQVLICLNPRFTCSPNTINYLQSYGLAGSHFTGRTLFYCLTPDGVELAKALFRSMS